MKRLTLTKIVIKSRFIYILIVKLIDKSILKLDGRSVMQFLIEFWQH